VYINTNGSEQSYLKSAVIPKSSPNNSLVILLVLGVIVVLGWVFLGGSNPLPPANATGTPGVSMTSTPDPQYDTDGNPITCGGDGTGIPIKFTDGKPEFLTDGKPNEKLPRLGAWYCFNSDAWQTWVTREFTYQDKIYQNLDALVNAIMKAEGLTTQGWLDALTTAIRASIGTKVLVLPPKADVPPARPTPTDPGKGGGRDTPAPQPPEQTPLPPSPEPPNVTVTVTPTATRSPAEDELLQLSILLQANVSTEFAEAAKNGGTGEYAFDLGTISFDSLVDLAQLVVYLPNLSPQGLEFRDSDATMTCVRVLLDGRRACRFLVSGIRTSFPVPGGNATWQPGYVHFTPLYPGNGNYWGKDENGWYDMPWGHVYLYPVVIVHTPLPAEPAATEDLSWIPTVQAFQTAIPTETPKPDEPTATLPPTPTATPMPVNQLSFPSMVYSVQTGELNNNYFAVCTLRAGSSSLADCAVTSKSNQTYWYFVDFWVGNCPMPAKFNFTTYNYLGNGCPTLPDGWFIIQRP
jgi:hypothetical protein